MPASAAILLLIQTLLLGIFCFFAIFKYLYGIASLMKKRFKRVPPSGHRCAVVIVAFNEEFVIDETIRACDALTYPNRLIVLADDSTDERIIAQRRELAVSRGCIRKENHSHREIVKTRLGNLIAQPIDIWESPEFVLFQRPSNTGYKAGSLKRVHDYLQSLGVEFIYILDADWHPQPDAIERAFEIIEADDRLAFVQTKRIARPGKLNLFQRITAIMEETCYFVDFEGRQTLNHPVLFSGCCALMRLDAIQRVGGFQAGNLTEDLDLSNRLWLGGWKGTYCGDIINTGEVPFSYDHYRRQQERWAAGTSAALRTYFWPILRSPSLSWMEKLAAIRQNSYFFSNVFTVAALLAGLYTIGWMLVYWDSYAVEYYLYAMTQLQSPIVSIIYGCIFSTLLGPVLMIVFHKRKPEDLLYLPMSIWHAWSVLYTYLAGNFKGLLKVDLKWFRTPKFNRESTIVLERTPSLVRVLYSVTFLILLSFYFVEGWAFGWFDFFAFIWIPAMFIASTK